ncbi:protein S100-A7-like [Elgaria multicarinata webbii]|uniref:protein S100-A7-like n=1 Tax=Elgaria multicarinata webbii TaxID=159646 RepID=UPI002FCCD295
MAATHSGTHDTSDCLPNCTLEAAMKIIVDIYHQYCVREGKNDLLSLKDLTELLKCQAPTFLAACNRNRAGYIEHLFKEADVNHDQQLTFKESIKVLSILADDVHRISHGEDRCGPDKD